MTKNRQLVLSLLENSSKPKNAEMIFLELEKSLHISTIYRILDLFLAENIISKYSLKNTTYYYINKKRHHHYMICLSCDTFYEISCQINNYLTKEISSNDFKVIDHEMIIYGYCKDCH